MKKFICIIIGSQLIACSPREKEVRVEKIMNEVSDEQINLIRIKVDQQYLNDEVTSNSVFDKLRQYYFSFDAYGRVQNCSTNQVILRFNERVSSYNKLLDSIGLETLEMVSVVNSCDELKAFRKKNMLSALYNEEKIIERYLK